MSFINNAQEVVKYWSNKREIDETVRRTYDLLENFRHLASGVEGIEKLQAPNYVLQKLKALIESIEIKRIFTRFPEGYVGIRDAVLRNIWSAFAQVAKHIPPEDILPMASVLSRNSIFELATKGDARIALRGLSELAQNCPADDKLRLYSTFDGRDNLLPHLVQEGNDRHLIALFLSRSFEGVDSDQVLAVLRHSLAWAYAPKDKGMGEYMIDQNQSRLLPALNFDGAKEVKTLKNNSTENRKGVSGSSRNEKLSKKLAEHPIVVGLGIIASIVTILAALGILSNV